MQVCKEMVLTIYHEPMIWYWWYLPTWLISMRCWSWPKVKVTKLKVKVKYAISWKTCFDYISWTMIRYWWHLFISIICVFIINIQSLVHDIKWKEVFLQNWIFDLDVWPCDLDLRSTSTTYWYQSCVKVLSIYNHWFMIYSWNIFLQTCTFDLDLWPCKTL